MSDANLSTDDSEKISISKNEFLPGPALPVDVFVRLTNGKYVAIAKKGSKSSLAELHVSRSQIVDSFYIRKQDYTTIIEHNLSVLKIIVKRSDIPATRRLIILKTASDSVLNGISKLGVGTDSMDQIRRTAEAIYELIRDHKDYLELTTSLAELPSSHLEEALMGAGLAILVAKELGWKSAESLEKIALGAFLRDFGLLKLPKELFEKDLSQMSGEESKLWETHPELGAQSLGQIVGLPREVVTIAREHHENAVGRGFPRRIRDSEMNPYSKVVALVDKFVSLTIGGKSIAGRKSPELAVQQIEFSLGCPYNRACLVALKKTLQLDTKRTSPFPTITISSKK